MVFGVMVGHLFGKAEEDAEEEVDRVERIAPVALLVAEVLAGLATDTTVYLSRRGEALKVNKLTFAIRASDSSWHPGRPIQRRMRRRK